MLKFFDFVLSLAAVIALLLATYLFATDNNVNKSIDEVSVQKQPASGGVSGGDIGEKSFPATSTATTSAKWKYIVIHHSSTQNGNAKIFDHYQREEKKIRDGLIYHFVIGNGSKSGNGEIEVGERWHKKMAGPHCLDPKMNEQSIGICLVGDFEKTKPTKTQINALVDLLKKLQKDFQIPKENIIGRNEVDKGKTDSPGKNFSITEIRAKLTSQTANR